MTLPTTALVRALQANWPAEEEVRLGPWLLRRGGGGRRTEAATIALEDVPVTREDVAEAAAAMIRWGQRPTFLLREGHADLDALLAAQGYVRVAETILYSARPEEIAHRVPDLAVIDCDGPLAVLQDIWREGGVLPARLAVMGRVTAPKRYLLGRVDDRPAGAAFLSAAAGTAMLNALHVRPAARRRGVARRIVQWAAAWAVEERVDLLALAVEADNAPARALYEKLGMEVSGGYGYRVAP